MWMQEQSKYENTGYVALWGLLFAAPVLSLYVRSTGDSEIAFSWQEVWMVWRHFAVYLLLFLVHNFLLAPLLIYRNKRWLYCLLALCMIAVFTAYQCTNRPDHMRRHQPHAMEQRGPRPMEQRGLEPMDRGDFEPTGRGFDHEPPPKPKGNRMDRKPPVFIGEKDIVAIVVLILMCGMNLGVKLYFKTRNDQKKLKQLEKENLQQQLEYLKYQINPHFFMNTLNNIHALVDIDSEKAKDTILELSKMMRFVLYEGDKEGVPLSKEFEFIRTYVQLMRLRYTDKVKISLDLPTEAPDKTVPPLMLISFVENAFKHGISYQHESFIDIHIAISDWPFAMSKEPRAKSQMLTFSCRNSKADKPNEEKGGVGLANVKKRLNLLYDNNYTLNIQDETDVYSVELTLPLNS
jgi:hypothetical protein